MSAALIAGIGLRPGTSEADIAVCLDLALAKAGLTGAPVTHIATLAARAAEPGLLALARDRAAELVAIPDEALKGFEASCATRSTRVAALYGVGSVAEAAALAAAGPGGTLILPRVATARVTCALAGEAQALAGEARPLPPACGGEGLGMGGRKAGTPSFLVAPSGTAPHPNPPHRKRGEGVARGAPQGLSRERPAGAVREATVHFIGAGPGAPDLITLRGRDLIATCPVCLYAGSLIPRAMLDWCPKGARIVDTAPLDLDAIVAEMRAAHAAGLDVARLHSGDLSIWSATAEQMRRLDALAIPYTVTPGVPAFAAAAAALRRELTLPGVAQSLVLTRTSGRASAMPERERLAVFAASGATLAIHLSIHAIDQVVEALAPFYGPDCPVAVVFRASWPDERVLRGTLADIAGQVRAAGLERSALILVGPALGAQDFGESALYSVGYDRRFRPGGGV